MDRDVLDPDEARQALDDLSTVDLSRLRAIGRNFALGLACGADDLIGEAVASTLLGERKCPRDVKVVTYLANAMRSIAWRTRESAARVEPVASLDATGTDGRPLVVAVAHEPDAETLRLRQEGISLRIAAIEELFADDDEALLLFWADLEETPKEDFKMTNDLDDTSYNSLRRRMRRKINARFPDGWTL